MPFDGSCEPLTDTEIAARDDLWRILDDYPNEAPVVLAACKAGKIDGEAYGMGFYTPECGCVFSHIGAARGLPGGSRVSQIHREMHGIGPLDYSPLEEFIFNVRPGDTPATSPVVAKLTAWIEQWQARQAEG